MRPIMAEQFGCAWACASRSSSVLTFPVFAVAVLAGLGWRQRADWLGEVWLGSGALIRGGGLVQQALRLHPLLVYVQQNIGRFVHLSRQGDRQLPPAS